MKILFIGSVEFSESCLELLIDLKENIVGICTLEKSLINTDFIDLQPLAEKHKIPVHYSPDINSLESLEWINSLKPDIIFCFGWSRLIKKDLLELAPMGVLGFHPAELPKNRGRHPLIWALAFGLSKTASTFFFMDEGADSGKILSQEEISIALDDDASSLYKKVTKTATKQIKFFLPNLKRGSFTPTIQDSSLSNTWRKRGKEDGKIDWRMPSLGIYNLVRALSKPYIGAHFLLNESEVKVWKCSVISDAPSNIEPGKIISFGKKGPIIKAGIGAIELEKFDLDKKLVIGEYL